MPTKDERLARLVECSECGAGLLAACVDLRDGFWPLKHPHRERIEAGKKFVAEKGVENE